MMVYSLWRLFWFVVLFMVQMLVLNQIHLFNYATPLLYVYFVITFRRGYPKWAILLWSFALGLSCDMLVNTPGVAAASMTLIGAIQPYLLELFIPRDSIETLNVSARTLGWTKFTVLTSTLVVIYCMLFYALEMFTTIHWFNWLMNTVGSILITLLLIFPLETIRKS